LLPFSWNRIVSFIIHLFWLVVHAVFKVGDEVFDDGNIAATPRGLLPSLQEGVRGEDLSILSLFCIVPVATAP
jgi:hypothetical protein